MKRENEINDLEEMKAMWNDLDQRVRALEENSAAKSCISGYNKIRTAREKLIAKYRSFTFLSLLMIVYFPLLFWNLPVSAESYRIPVIIYCTLFFLFEASVDTFLMLRIKSLDVYNSTVSEIARKSAQCWKIHKMAVIAGIPLAAGAFILIFLLMNANLYALLGMITGGLVGLALAIRHLRRIMHYYRLLQ